MATEITQPAPPLLSVSSYYEYQSARKAVLDTLRPIFRNKKWPTAVDFLIARAAHWHLLQTRRARKNYLIVTTNYDQLMEIALDRFKVPYCVLTVNKNTRHVDVMFSSNMQKHLDYTDGEFKEFRKELNGTKDPAHFSLETNPPIVLLYKMHGSSIEAEEGHDSIVLSDEDYILYLRRLSDNAGMIPCAVSELMFDKGFLFLGYSFSDWNVRAIHRTLEEKRLGGTQSTDDRSQYGISVGTPEIRDYAVIRDLNVYESAFFRQRNICLLQTELDCFSRHLKAEAHQRGVAQAVSLR